jgi:hypothetical protein
MPFTKEPEKELLSSLYALGSLMSNNEDWFERRFETMENILKDSWAYKKWTAQGRQQGLQQGIVSLVQKRFPSLTTLAQERVALLTTPEKLQDLLLEVGTAKDEQETRSSLLKVSEERKQ